MTDSIQYHPDEGPRRRLSEANVNRPAIPVDKPIRAIRMRPMATRAATLNKHYPRKTPKRRKWDLRDVEYF